MNAQIFAHFLWHHHLGLHEKFSDVTIKMMHKVFVAASITQVESSSNFCHKLQNMCISGHVTPCNIPSNTGYCIWKDSSLVHSIASCLYFKTNLESRTSEMTLRPIPGKWIRIKLLSRARFSCHFLVQLENPSSWLTHSDAWCVCF